ncbi:MAG: MFS transporter small subunit [Angustibacter sp.]
MTIDRRAMRAMQARRKPANPTPVMLAWSVVLIPLGYGVFQTVLRAARLFTTGS